MSNVPDELAEEWLAPYVQELGPPTATGRWFYILAGRSPEFWRKVDWQLEAIIELLSANFTPHAKSRLAIWQLHIFWGARMPIRKLVTVGNEP